MENEEEIPIGVVIFFKIILSLLLVYGLLLFWPYLIFCAVPFLLVSLVVGFGLRHFTQLSVNKEETNLNINCRGLIIFYSLFICVNLMLFHLNSTRMIGKDSLGRNMVVRLEWPGIHNVFNKYRLKAHDQFSFFEPSRLLSQNEVIYDREELGWIFWFSLFIGGPFFYFVLIRGRENETQIIIDGLILKKVRERELKIQKREFKLEQTLEDKTYDYKMEIKKTREELKRQIERRLLLEARLEYSPKGKRLKDEVKIQGVLEEGLL